MMCVHTVYVDNDVCVWMMYVVNFVIDCVTDSEINDTKEKVGRRFYQSVYLLSLHFLISPSSTVKSPSLLFHIQVQKTVS